MQKCILQTTKERRYYYSNNNKNDNIVIIIIITTIIIRCSWNRLNVKMVSYDLRKNDHNICLFENL